MKCFEDYAWPTPQLQKSVRFQERSTFCSHWALFWMLNKFNYLGSQLLISVLQYCSFRTLVRLDLSRFCPQSEKECGYEAATVTSSSSAAEIAAQVRMEIHQARRLAASQSCQQLGSNPPDVLEESLATLTKIYANATESREPRFRRIKCSSELLQRTVLEVPGGERSLLAAGFVPHAEHGAEFMVLPDDANTSQLLGERARIERLQEQLTEHLAAKERERMLQVREAMKQEMLSAMEKIKKPSSAVKPTSASSSTSPMPAEVPKKRAGELRPQLRDQLLHRLMNGASAQERTARETEARAVSLIEAIAADMEWIWRLEGERGVCAPWRAERQALLQRYREDSNIEYLEQLKEEWDGKLKETERRTKKSIADFAKICSSADPVAGSNRSTD
eukprot:NODE_1543_length_1498_cov_22.530711_g1392_i0.p1 GENE.NODE_1543_length_1498_cov_22.530711_g1392_i0~~NODE_1543_length_1498_cov_22.530711_g1392_i0.p1  ORF type:complete len:391 (-),score=63.54 NODE_1543_length_1498_cov_22.530711_g1392_i0:152-1324(-)